MSPSTQGSVPGAIPSSTLEERIARLEDFRLIEELKYEYAVCLDTGYDMDRLCRILTADARWSANGFGDFTGHQAIRDFFSGLAKSVVDVLHVVTSPRIAVAPDGASATGEFYLIGVSRSRRPSEPSAIDRVLTLGTYEDRFVKVGGGWLFSEIKVQVKHASRF